MRKILITGGTGFVGKNLVRELIQHFPELKLTIVGRDIQHINQAFSPKKFTCFDAADWRNIADIIIPKTWTELDAELISQQDIIIHLAGQNIAQKRWSPKVKQAILDSRVNTTEQLARLCAEVNNPEQIILSASAVGIYGHTGNYMDQPMPVDETWPIPQNITPDFLSKVGQAWEGAWQPVRAIELPLLIMRFGVVLDKQDGMLKKILPSVKSALAGKLGSGEQWLSWIALQDLLRAILFFIEHPALIKTHPVVNFTHPKPVQQQEFIRALTAHYHRPCFAHMPAALVKLLFGEMGSELLLNGQNVVPKELEALGFDFSVADIQAYCETL